MIALALLLLASPADLCGSPPGVPALWLDGDDGLPAVNKGAFGGSFSGTATAVSECIGWPASGCLRFDGTQALTSSFPASSWTWLHSASHTCLSIVRTRVWSPESNQTVWATSPMTTAGRGAFLMLEDAGSAENRFRADQKNGGSTTNNRLMITNGLKTQVWQRAVVTFDAALSVDAMVGYVDGSVVGTSGAQMAAPSTSAPTSTLVIGAAVNAHHLDGDVAQVVCYDGPADLDALNAWARCIEGDAPDGPRPLPTLWSTSTLCHPSAAPCRVGVIGDSLTSVTSPSSWANGAFRAAWPAVYVDNVAVGGTTAEIARTVQWGALAARDTHALVVLIGTNDIAAGTLADDVLDDIDEIADSARLLGLKVATVSLLPRGSAATSTPARIAQLHLVNEGLALRADGVYRVHVDAYAVLGDPVNPDNLAPIYDSGDGLHPNQAGHDALGAFVAASLTVQEVP